MSLILDEEHPIFDLLKEVSNKYPNISLDEWASILNDARHIGIEDERYRIINILKSTNRLTTVEGGTLFNYADEAIAIIKGENK